MTDIEPASCDALFGRSFGLVPMKRANDVTEIAAEYLAELASDELLLEQLAGGPIVGRRLWVHQADGNDFSAIDKPGIARAFDTTKRSVFATLAFAVATTELETQRTGGTWSAGGAPFGLKLQRVGDFADTRRTSLTIRYRMPIPQDPDPVWVFAARDFFTRCSLLTGAQLGDLRPTIADPEHKEITPLNRFRWVYPLVPEAVVPQVEYYGWLVWLHPVSVERLGGADRVEREAPVHLVERHDTDEGTALVAQLSDHPRSLTTKILNEWRTYLLPAMNARPAFEAGQNPTPPPTWVHPDDW